MELVSDSDSDGHIPIMPPSAGCTRTVGGHSPAGSLCAAASTPRSEAPPPSQARASPPSYGGMLVKETSPLPTPKRRGLGRPRKSREPVETTDEEDDVVFLRETTVRGLAERFSFGNSNAEASSSTRPKTKTSSTAKKTTKPRTRRKPTPSLAANATPSASGSSSSLALYPDRDPLPVPDWLGRPAVLLQLSTCVVCRIKVFKRESGPERWRHISACLPPLFRPPNPPPDLKTLLYDELKPKKDMTLMEHQATRANEERPDRRGKLNVTTVTASHFSAEWDVEVAGRITHLVGASSPPAPRRRSRSGSPSMSSASPPPKRCSLGGSGTASPTPSSYRSASPEHLPSTQPMGESSLASQYARPPRSRSPSPEILLQAPPRIGLTQSVRTAFEAEEAILTQRAATAMSQAVRRRHLIPDEHEDDGGGLFTPSQAAGPACSRAVSPSVSSTLSSQHSYSGAGRFASPTPPFVAPPGASSGAGRTRETARVPPKSAEEQERVRAARRRAIALGLASV